MSDFPKSTRTRRFENAIARWYEIAEEQRKRLTAIAGIIETVDNRCMAADGPVTPTLQEMTQVEMSEIYRLATGKKTEGDDDE